MAFGGRQTKKLEDRRAYSRTRINTVKRLDGRDPQIRNARDDAVSQAFVADADLQSTLETTIDTYHNQVLAEAGDNGVVVPSGKRSRTIRYNTPLTNNRTVTLPNTPDDGDRIRVIRQAGATGTHDLLVKNVSGGTIYTISVVNRFVEVEFSVNALNWIVTAAGATT